MTTLTEFLLARISADENAARGVVPCDDVLAPGCWDEARVLAECAAKRQIIEAAQSYHAELEHGDNGEWAFDHVLRLLAAPFRSHPDFNVEWGGL